MRVPQPGPQQVPRGIHLRGFIEGVHGSFEIAGLHGLVGHSQLLVQGLDRVGLLGGLGLLLLHLLQLLGSNALLLGGLDLGLLQIEIQRGLVASHGKIVDLSPVACRPGSG